MPSIEYYIFRILRLLRKLPINLLSFGSTTSCFLEFFKDFDKVPAVQGIFGEKATEILSQLRVEFSWVSGYMYVDGSDGHLVISKGYLNNGNKTDIYLDLIHELCHVKQFMEGKELFDPQYDYVERPTEIEAYRYAVEEARRLGLSEERIRRYLRTEWMNEHDFCRLAKSVNVAPTSPHGKLEASAVRKGPK
ncbi:MAG: hypothetical protein NWE98_01260 [Candidatus Bathyarchaeota archaeon]|nr:hypothetical protein [Candidatus Bathyarchaeota archaeon]